MWHMHVLVFYVALSIGEDFCSGEQCHSIIVVVKVEKVKFYSDIVMALVSNNLK